MTYQSFDLTINKKVNADEGNSREGKSTPVESELAASTMTSMRST